MDSAVREGRKGSNAQSYKASDRFVKSVWDRIVKEAKNMDIVECTRYTPPDQEEEGSLDRARNLTIFTLMEVFNQLSI